MTRAQLTIRLPATVILFISVWEVCARVDDRLTWGAPLLALYDQSVLMTTDELGVTGKPGGHYLKWKMNSLGFRGPELLADREKIICIGASETFGMYEPEGLEYPRQLERELNLRAGTQKYQVVNAGLPGQSLSSFARRAVKVMREVRPSIAVLYPSLAIYIDPPPERVPAGSGQPGPEFRLRIAGKLFELLRQHVPEYVQTGDQRFSIRQQTRGQTVFSRIPEASVVRFGNDLSTLLDLLEGEGVRPLLATHATRFGRVATPADAPMLTAWRTLHPTLGESGFLDMEGRLNSVIRNAAAQRNLMFADAAAILHGPGDFVEFVHFTPGGAGKLARVIADEIVSFGPGSEAGRAGDANHGYKR